MGIRIVLCLVTVCCAWSQRAYADQPLVKIEGGYSAPQRLFVGVDLTTRLNPRKAGLQAAVVRDAEGWYVNSDVTVGRGGWKVGAGLARCCVGRLDVGAGDTGVGWSFASTIALRGTFTRTWGAPRGVEPNRSFVGAEVQYSLLLLLDLNAGVMYPVASRAAQGPVFTWGVGIGLPLLGF